MCLDIEKYVFKVYYVSLAPAKKRKIIKKNASSKLQQLNKTFKVFLINDHYLK